MSNDQSKKSGGDTKQGKKRTNFLQNIFSFFSTSKTGGGNAKEVDTKKEKTAMMQELCSIAYDSAKASLSIASGQPPLDLTARIMKKFGIGVSKK